MPLVALPGAPLSARHGAGGRDEGDLSRDEVGSRAPRRGSQRQSQVEDGVSKPATNQRDVEGERGMVGGGVRSMGGKRW